MPVVVEVHEGEAANGHDLSNDLVEGGAQVEGVVGVGFRKQELHSGETVEGEASASDADGEGSSGGGELSIEVAVVGVGEDQQLKGVGASVSVG